MFLATIPWGPVPSFIEHRKCSEQALISVIQEAVVKGVSTRKIEAVLEEFGIAGVRSACFHDK